MPAASGQTVLWAAPKSMVQLRSARWRTACSVRLATSERPAGHFVWRHNSAEVELKTVTLLVERDELELDAPSAWHWPNGANTLR